MKRHPFVALVAGFGAAALLFHFLFLWMYTNIDGYFYWAIGRYFTTGTYPFIAPFIYEKPTTVSPPLYGLFLALIGTLPQADILLHAIHLILFAITSILLFSMLKRIVSANTAACISLLFLLFPANVIYTGSMMTELPAQTAMTVYIYLMTRWFQSHRPAVLFWAILLAAVMTLLKYQFMILFLVSGSILVWTMHTRPSGARLPIIGATIGTLLILFWVGTNHAVTGVWGLSDTKKMPFYTNFVWDGRHFPPETDPSVVALRRYVPKTADRYAEYWDLEDYILPYTHRDWTKVDELLGSVGLAAVRTYPAAYGINGLRIFVQTLTDHAPWWHNLETFGSRDPVQPLFCDHLGSIRFCRPIIYTALSYRLWNTYVALSRAFYDLVIPPLLVFVFLPSLILTLFHRRWHIKFYGIIYLLNLVPISYLAMVESRYLVPYYPLMILIMAYGIQTVRVHIIAAAKKRTSRKANQSSVR